MKASEAREIFNRLNSPPTVEERILIDINKGYPGTSVPRMCDNHPLLKKLEKKGYLVSHSNTLTYITWAY